MTITETPAPRIDFTPLLDLRERYTARAADLSAGIAERDPERIDEARALIAEEERISDELVATLRPTFDTSHEQNSRDGVDAFHEIVWAIRATGDLSVQLDEFDSQREEEVVVGIVDRVLEYLGDEMRSHEVVLTPPAVGWVEMAASEFAQRVREGWISGAAS